MLKSRLSMNGHSVFLNVPNLFPFLYPFSLIGIITVIVSIFADLDIYKGIARVVSAHKSDQLLHIYWSLKFHGLGFPTERSQGNPLQR